MAPPQPAMSQPDSKVIGCGVSRNPVPAEALREAVQGLDLARAAFVLVYVPADMPLAPLEAALADQLGGLASFGCTTAGTITERGYEDHALMVLAFPRAHFRCASVLVAPLRDLEISAVAGQVAQAAEKFARTAGWNRLALIMADGLSLQEDLFAAAVGAGLPGLPVFGGSAGDGLRFGRTHLLKNGRFHDNAGCVILIESDLGFVGLGFDHFLPTGARMVVTDAQPEQRIVRALNGSPAAQEYARLVGCAPADLSPEIFAENPLLLRHGESFHVRAVRQVEPDGCLRFLSAIDDGLILTLGRGAAHLDILRGGLSPRDPAGHAPCFILGFECILRRLEFSHKALSAEVSAILRDAHVRGFCTYGEQHRGVHVNQTFVGVAFYPPQTGPSHD